VDGAIGYLVYVNDDEYSGVSPFALTELNLVVGQTYKVCVKAKGDGYLKLSSEKSTTIDYVAIQKSSSNSLDDQAQEPPTETQQVTDSNLANELYESGLGYGVNALTAKNAVGEVRSAAFFDESLFTVNNVGSYSIGSSRSKATSKESINDEIVSINSKLVYGNSGNMSVFGGMFTAGFEEKFSLSNAIETQNHINQYYFIMNHYIVGKNYQMKDYQQPRAYSDKISEYAIADIENIRAGRLSAETFFNRYGTHLTMAVSYGGMTEVYYATFSRDTINSAEIGVELENKLNAKMSYNGNSVSGATEFAAEMNAKYRNDTQTRTTKLYIESIGKTPLTALTFDSFAQSYPNWVESMKDESNYRVVDVADRGLVPIWTYFPDEFSDVAKMLENEFNERAISLSNALVNKMTPPESAPAKTATMDLIPKNCKDNNHFNTADPWNDTVAQNEINKQLFQLIINGTAQSNEKYQIVGDFALGLKLVQDIENIEVYKISGSRVYNATLSDDTYNGVVKDTTIAGRIGKGAVYINATYLDGTTEQGYATNICNGKNKNSYIDVLAVTGFKINQNKKISSIEIVTVYEIAAWWKDGLGLVSYSTITNWRTDTILYFI
ncbi:MAG: MAC/perforin domain-containing protein, partial [Christensenellales bacterium]